MSDDLIYGIRNDVDELLVARDSLAKRISELEKNGERDYLNIDANRDQINANLEGIEDCWKELKEKLDGKKGSGGEKEMVNKGIGDDSLVDKPELIRLSSNERVLDLKEGIPSIHSKPPEPSCDTCKNKLNLPKTKCAVDGFDIFSRYESGENDYEQFFQAYEGYWKKKYDEVLLKFVKKIEGFRLKFEKEDGYMAVQFFEDVMEYKRKLEARLK